MVAERRVASIGRVGEGVALVESPAGLDADLLGPGGRRHLQLCGERDLKTGGDDSGIRHRVVEDRPVAGARQEYGPATAVRSQIGGERLAQLLVRPESRSRVTLVGGEKVERVAGDDKGAWALGQLERAGELHRCVPGYLRPLRAQEEVAHDDHAPAGGDSQAGDAGVLGHRPSIVAVSQAADR